MLAHPVKCCPPVRPPVGILEIQEFWNLEIWDPTNIQKKQILKITNRVAQNVGKVQISREKILLIPLGAISGIF